MFKKPHQRTLNTWAFFKINNNQKVDLQHSQIMQCIVYHSETMGLKVIGLHIRYHKRFIAYNKVHNMWSKNMFLCLRNLDRNNMFIFKVFLIGNQQLNGRMLVQV